MITRAFCSGARHVASAAIDGAGLWWSSLYRSSTGHRSACPLRPTG